MTNNTIERKEVRVFQVDYRCPKCGEGYLRPTGIVCSLNPPVRPHKCNNPDCDYGEIITGNAYPYMDYKPINHIIQFMDVNGMISYINGKGPDEHCVDPSKVIHREPELIREDRDVPSVINDYPIKTSGK